MKEISLPYGYSLLKVGIPDRSTFNILDSKYVAGVKNEREAILESLMHPLRSSPLPELIGSSLRLAIARRKKSSIVGANSTTAVAARKLSWKLARKSSAGSHRSINRHARHSVLRRSGSRLNSPADSMITAIIAALTTGGRAAEISA